MVQDIVLSPLVSFRVAIGMLQCERRIIRRKVRDLTMSTATQDHRAKRFTLQNWLIEMTKHLPSLAMCCMVAAQVTGSSAVGAM